MRSGPGLTRVDSGRVSLRKVKANASVASAEQNQVVSVSSAVESSYWSKKSG